MRRDSRIRPITSRPSYEQRPYVVPADATEVILVRHGASAAAVPDEPFELVEGRGDPPLAPVGEAQAAAVGEHLAGQRLAAIFTSNLQRTHQTAAPLVERTGLEPVALADLNEVSLGDWEGGAFRIHAHAGNPLFLEVIAQERWDLIPNAEPADAFAARARRGLDAVVATTGPGATAAVFAHGALIAELCRQATGSTPFAFMPVENGSLTRLVVLGDGRLRLRGFNETSHLA